jgi:hypothetical protein
LKSIVFDFINFLNRKSYRHSIVFFFFVSDLVHVPLPLDYLYVVTKYSFRIPGVQSQTSLILSNFLQFPSLSSAKCWNKPSVLSNPGLIFTECRGVVVFGSNYCRGTCYRRRGSRDFPRSSRKCWHGTFPNKFVSLFCHKLHFYSLLFLDIKDSNSFKLFIIHSYNYIMTSNGWPFWKR